MVNVCFLFSDKNRTEGMTGRSSAKRRTAPCLLALLLLLFFHLSPSSVGGEPIPSEFYGKTSDNDFVSIHSIIFLARFILAFLCSNRLCVYNKSADIAQQAEGVVRGETVRGGTGERVGQGTYEDPVDNNGREGIGDTIGLGLLR